MAWNLFLALIPLVLSFWLFRKTKSPDFFWWLILGIFILFLPNAPYVLTDIIHLIRKINHGYSIWIITLILIPQYLIFFFIGIQAYTISVMKMGIYLRYQKLLKFRLIVELIIHALCAIGIYLGRFQRLNSWYFFKKPVYILKITINYLTTQQSLLIILITFIILTIIYTVMKQINLGIVLRINKEIQKASQKFNNTT